MAQAGVQFANGSQLDFVQIRQADTLLTTPPPRINDTLGLIHRLNHDIDLVKRLDPFR